jgi:hypothetical protein
MHYLVRFETEQLAMEEVEDRNDVYFAPEGDRAWAILEARDEESLRQNLEGQGLEEVQPMLPAREYMAIAGARRDLEDSKTRFVDDPPGALAEARQAVGRALEARGYPSSERAGEASGARQEVLREYQNTDTGDSGNLEEVRGSFNRLSDLLDRIART